MNKPGPLNFSRRIFLWIVQFSTTTVCYTTSLSIARCYNNAYHKSILIPLFSAYKAYEGFFNAAGGDSNEDEDGYYWIWIPIMMNWWIRTITQCLRCKNWRIYSNCLCTLIATANSLVKILRFHISVVCIYSTMFMQRY